MTTAFSKPKISLSHPNPRLLIVGAGIGGLTLANLCEAVGFDYLILEKTSEFKPLGSAINLNQSVFAFLDQLGIYKDLLKVAHTYGNLTVQTADLGTRKTRFDGNPSQTNPKNKDLDAKKVLTVQQNKDGVVVHVSDGTSYHGHLLVGADGCYSPVRESMFAEIEKHRKLPPSDKAPLSYDIDCIVGVTLPLDPAEFPDLAKNVSEFKVVLPKTQKVSIWFMPLSRNRLGWMVNEVMSDEKRAKISGSVKKSKGENEANVTQADWGSESADAMLKRFCNHPTPYGKAILQTFIDKTPRELISKVLLEEKFFETWQDGRTCLIGDACHKVLPFGAVGAQNAMLDALQLANLLYDLKSTSYESIREMLIQYESLRKEHGRAAVNGSATGGKLFHAKGWTGTLARHILLNVIPAKLITKGYERVARYRPMCTFLPFKTLGTVKYDKQEYSVRYLMEQEESGGARKFDGEVLREIDGSTTVYGAIAV